MNNRYSSEQVCHFYVYVWVYIARMPNLRLKFICIFAYTVSLVIVMMTIKVVIQL